MNVLSLFSGVGGFDIGLERAGMRTVYQCEWDKHATSILQKHWSDIPRWGDISTLTAKEILSHGTPPDVVAWGSPCQDLSVAGKRAGLDGQRSGLFHQGIRIIKELREETNNEYPRISIWENVAGALSSNGGADFGVILNEMAEAGALVIEWAILDAQHFGVPQRRRRVFVIAIFDSAIARNCPDPLLPVSESLRGDSQKGKSKGKAVTRKIANCLRVGSGIGERGDGSDNLVIGFSHTQGLSAQPSEVAFPTLRTEGSGMAVAYPIDTRNALRDPEKKDAQNRQGLGVGNDGDPSPTVTSAFVPAVVQSYDEYNDRLGGGIHHALRAGTKQSTGVLIENEVVGTLRSGGDGGVPSSRGEHLVVAPSLTASNDPSRSPQSAEVTQQVTAVYQASMAVRRLTPLECERLMGWPDDHTRWKADGTEQADTHRYKQCGNGVASPVAEWIGRHILAIMKDNENAQQRQ